MSYGIGIDLGGTRIKSARFDLETGRLLGSMLAPTCDGEIRDGLPAFAVGVRDLVQAHEAEMGAPARLVGVSAPGLAARDGSCIRFMPGKLLGLENLVWSDFLERPARCLNDAHAALMGEIWQGAARGKSDAVMLTLGTGVGGAVVCDGRLLQGHLGRAGHLGHVTVDLNGPLDATGSPGSIEYEIGNGHLAQRSGGRFLMTSDLLDAVERDDPDATALWDRSVRSLGATVAGLINCFDPEVFLIGGGIANAWNHLESRLQGWLDQYEWRPGGHRVPVLHATLGEWAGCHGAVHFAMPILNA